MKNLILFPLVFLRFTLHHWLYLGGLQDGETLWKVYDSGVYEIIVYTSVYRLMAGNCWQRDLSLIVLACYFSIGVLFEWSGHNLRGDILDSSLQALAAIVAGLLALWWMEEKKGK